MRTSGNEGIVGRDGDGIDFLVMSLCCEKRRLDLGDRIEGKTGKIPNLDGIILTSRDNESVRLLDSDRVTKKLHKVALFAECDRCDGLSVSNADSDAFRLLLSFSVSAVQIPDPDRVVFA